jgi:hypothetical protein
MAKISKKQDPPKKAAEPDEMLEFIMESMMEGMEDYLRLRGPEPINHVPQVDILREDIDVKLFKTTLNLKALKYDCFEEDKVNYMCMERSFGRIFRTVELPVPVNTSKTKAIYKNGILTIVMPRIEEKRGKPRSITIEPF